jgi:hypothetical protein
MKTVQLSISLVDGRIWNVTGYKVGSFAVHAGNNINENLWTISHIPTGMNAVNGICFSKSRAFKIARMLTRVFSDSDMQFVAACADKFRHNEGLTKEDNFKYQALYAMMWADHTISKYAK